MTTWKKMIGIGGFGKGDKQASTSQGKPNASNEESSLKLFTKSAIMNATNNLSKESMIGSGGFGKVYKGTIDNAEVAIKILDAKSTQGEKEFIQEMTVLENLKHENLVKLMGACLKQRALVYEFLPRGSLEDCLNNSPRLLTWQIRARIVYEICSVLMFLHSMKPEPVVHGDLKPQNILLDADLHCRLSDFGLCRFLPEFSETTGAYLQTKSISGTECYIDPDFLEHGKLTPGCDVFSFGVTILRILTGLRPLKIRRKIRKASRSNSLMTIVDSTAGDWPVEVAEYLAKSGLDCCKEKRNNLKIMTELSTFLENLAEKGCFEMSRKCQPDLVVEVPRVLEPTMKERRGNFSKEEEDMIVSLHEKPGNSRPTSMQERTRDSDDDEIQDWDYDVTALANNLSQAFRYNSYENEDEDVYFDDESAEVVISSLRLGDDHGSSLFANSNWFAFQEDKIDEEPLSTSTPEEMDIPGEDKSGVMNTKPEEMDIPSEDKSGVKDLSKRQWRVEPEAGVAQE